MATPIKATPVLKGKDARDFEGRLEEGLLHPVGPVPTPKLEEAMKKLRRAILGLEEQGDDKRLEIVRRCDS
jgi:hypothetical protein